MKEPKFAHFFLDTKEAMDLLDKLIDKNRDNNFKKELNTIKISIQLLDNEKIIDTVFKNYREDKIKREELLKTLKRYRNSSDPLFVVSVFICSLIATQDVNLSQERNILVKNVNDLKALLDNLGRFENSYVLRCNIIDLIYQVRERYFIAYEDDILAGIKWVDAAADELNDFAEKTLSTEVLPKLNVKPEQLGFIDITKLKNKES